MLERPLQSNRTPTIAERAIFGILKSCRNRGYLFFFNPRDYDSIEDILKSSYNRDKFTSIASIFCLLTMRPLQLLKLQCHPGKCDGDCQVCKFACPRATNENAIFQFFCNATNRDTTLVDCVTIIVIWLGWPELNLDCGRLMGLQSNYDMLSSHVHNRLNCDDIQTNVMATVGL